MFPPFTQNPREGSRFSKRPRLNPTYSFLPNDTFLSYNNTVLSYSAVFYTTYDSLLPCDIDWSSPNYQSSIGKSFRSKKFDLKEN